MNFDLTFAQREACTDRQLTLFDFDSEIKSMGAARYYVGQLAEHFISVLLGASRIVQDSFKNYCPDLKLGSTFIESKAVGCNCQAFVYKGRLEKDWLFSRQKALFYVIVHHRAQPINHSRLGSLMIDFVNNLQGVYVIPFHAFYSICRRRRVESLNSGYGAPGNPLYGSGYRVSLGQLSDFLAFSMV